MPLLLNFERRNYHQVVPTPYHYNVSHCFVSISPTHTSLPYFLPPRVTHPFLLHLPFSPFSHTRKTQTKPSIIITRVFIYFFRKNRETILTMETTTRRSQEEGNTIEEDELELSLSLRPLRTCSIPKKVTETHVFLSKRDVQALCRKEAKIKRDLKRKINIDNSRDMVEVESRDKVQRLSPPSWWGWNPTACGGGGGGGGFVTWQGQNGNSVTVGGNVDGGANRESMSSGSSSGISDNYPGGNSSDAGSGSHSSHPHSQESQSLVPPNDVPATSTSHQTQPSPSQTELQPKLYGPSSNLRPPPQQIKSETPRTSSPQTPSPKEGKVDIGKPPKPNCQINQHKLVFSQMPCVSATGDGPNGKTISGFLYKYTKAEVSIVCVCHGASFTPAGFVEHAGCVDVEHPLKHIRVVPFALG